MFRRIAAIMALAVAYSGHGSAQTWDPAPLRSPTPIPKDGLPPERSTFFQWLQQHIGSLSESEAQLARERIYAYVAQAAKTNGGALPPTGDSSTTGLFRAAANLGVIGADQVAAALDPGATKPTPLVPPPGLALSLHGGLFALASDDSSWAVCFPYYFMPAPAGRQTPVNGVPTEVAVLSTLFAPDSGPAGSSQATVLILAAPVSDSLKHVTLWLHQLGLTLPPRSVPGVLEEWYSSSPGEPMHREAVIRRLPQRVILLGYIGVPGTFETNRPHFLDLLRTLATGHCAS